MSTLKPEEYSIRGLEHWGRKVPDVASGDLKMALRNPQEGSITRAQGLAGWFELTHMRL